MVQRYQSVYLYQFEVDVMKKKNREKAETENEDDMFVFSDLTTLGKKCLVHYNQ